MTEALAPGTVSIDCGGVSTKAVNGCVTVTVVLQLIPLLLTALTVGTAYVNHDVIISSISQSLARCMTSCMDFCLSSLLIVLWFCQSVRGLSVLACTFSGHLFEHLCFDGSLDWCFVAFLAWACVVLFFFASRSFFSRPVRRIFAARRIGARHFRHSRRRVSSLKSFRFRKFLRSALPLRLLSWPVKVCLCTVVRFSSLGELAVKGLTPACRGNNAGDGPVTPADQVFQNDAWAKFLNQKSKRDAKARHGAKRSSTPSVTRSRWTDCVIDMDQFKDKLNQFQFQPDQFQSNSTGVALLTRPLFIEAHAVRSPETTE